MINLNESYENQIVTDISDAIIHSDYVTVGSIDYPRNIYTKLLTVRISSKWKRVMTPNIIQKACTRASAYLGHSVTLQTILQPFDLEGEQIAEEFISNDRYKNIPYYTLHFWAEFYK